MNLIAISALALALVGPACCQPVKIGQTLPVPPQKEPTTAEEWRFSLVERLIGFPSPVTNGAPQLYGMGDEAAVDVLKVLSQKSTVTVEEMLAALDIIAMSFQHPESIIIPMNQKPMAAIFVLKYITTFTTDESVKARASKQTVLLKARMENLAAIERLSEKPRR